MNKRDAELIVRAFALYHYKYLAHLDAFPLPQWFLDARKEFTREETFKMFKEEEETIKGKQ